jgi:hypothetical protein
LCGRTPARSIVKINARTALERFGLVCSGLIFAIDTSPTKRPNLRCRFCPDGIHPRAKRENFNELSSAKISFSNASRLADGVDASTGSRKREIIGKTSENLREEHPKDFFPPYACFRKCERVRAAASKTALDLGPAFPFGVLASRGVSALL